MTKPRPTFASLTNASMVIISCSDYRPPFTIHHFYRQLFELKSRMQSINPMVDSAAVDLRIFNRLKLAIEFTPWSSADPYGLKWTPIATSMHNFRSQIGAPPHLDFYSPQWSSLNSLTRTIADAERIVALGMSATWQNFESGDSTPAASIDLLLQQNRQLTSGMHTTFMTGAGDDGDADSDGENSMNEDEVAYLTAQLDAAEVYIGAGAASPLGYVHKDPKLAEARRLAATARKTLAARKSHGTGKKPPFARKPAYKPSGSADSRGSGTRKPPDLDAVVRQLRAVSTKVDNLTHCMLGTPEASTRRDYLVKGVQRSA